MSPPDRAPRWIPLEGAVNARAVVPGVLLRSDNLQSLTPGDVRRLVDTEGVGAVLDLRTDVEVRLEGPGPMTHEPSVRIEHRSLYPESGGNTDLELEDADEPPYVRAYLNYVRRRPDSIIGSLRTIARAEDAVLVHCAAGKDRTGVVVALSLEAAGIDRDVIVADYLASAERIEAIFERLVGSPTYGPELAGVDIARLTPSPGTMERFLELFDERLGGPMAWLRANGLAPSDLERLRQRLNPASAAAA